MIYKEDERVVHDYLNVSFQSNIENKKTSLVIFYFK
jgi:hypothetical protein